MRGRQASHEWEERSSGMKLAAVLIALTTFPALAQCAVPRLEVLSVKQNLSESSSSTMGITADGLSVNNTHLMIIVHTAFEVIQDEENLNRGHQAAKLPGLRLIAVGFVARFEHILQHVIDGEPGS